MRSNHQEIFKELESLLDITDNELGFIEISNHIPYSDYLALKKKYALDNHKKISRGNWLLVIFLLVPIALYLYIRDKFNRNKQGVL